MGKRVRMTITLDIDPGDWDRKQMWPFIAPQNGWHPHIREKVWDAVSGRWWDWQDFDEKVRRPRLRRLSYKLEEVK